MLVSGRKDLKSPRYFAVDIIKGVQKSPVPIIWALSKSGLNSTDTTLSDVLRMLTVQSLQIPRSPTEEFLISPAEFENTTTDEEWLHLLKRALSGLKQVYIVVDTSILKGCASKRDQHQVVELMDKLSKQSRCTGLDLKIILVARRLADVSESPSAKEEPRFLHICSDASGKVNAKRHNLVIQAAKEQGPRYRAGCGRTKGFASLVGQALVDAADLTGGI